MASSSSSEAGPLPLKQGEIGFMPSSTQDQLASSSSTAEPSVQLPARHPADIDAPSSSTPAPVVNSSSAPTTDVSFVQPPKHKHALASKSIGGVRLTTILRFLAQLALALATIASWIVAAISIGKQQKSSSDDDALSSNPNLSKGGLSGSSSIFVHVVFTIFFLAQLLLLERRLFRIRAERYAHLHPGELLPTTASSYAVFGQQRQRRGSMSSLNIAPWNRPPLPTYAATLAQSGVGTGDVEDNAIAAPPPPAYGNTRGSRLLLQGFLSSEMRLARPASVVSRQSVLSSSATIRRDRESRLSRGWVGVERPQDGTSINDRPLSYRSRDGEWEEWLDAQRARTLEETLNALEEGDSNAAARRR